MAVLLGPDGRAIDKSKLTEEIATARIGTVRSPMSGYPADGLNPARLANILREADAGHPVRMMELFELIEERDAHYIGVLGTRRRSVSQIPITVEAASDDPEDEARAQLVRDWLRRDELTEEIFDILDCIGKGYSFTEIIWDTSEGEWMPRQLKRRDQRWFRFDHLSLEQPMMITGSLQEVPLPFGKFIYASIAAKSGLTLRSGLTRVAAWGWMFKAYTQRDWTIFTQTYSQPVRVGRFPVGAAEEDKATLFRAVANIAGDCAAIIPESMNIDFIESGNIGAAHTLYKERADWIDQQISKAVLGQTATTDAVVGGLGSGKEHRAVQKDIETADAKALAAILNRNLIRPWMQLNFGPLKRYPRLVIAQPDQEDLKAFSDAIVPMIDRGLEIGQGTILSRFGLPEAKPGAKMLRPMSPKADAGPATDPAGAATGPVSEIKRQSAEIKRGEAPSGTLTAPQAQSAPAGEKTGGLPEDVLADRLLLETAAPMEAMIGAIEEMTQAAGSLEELREMLLAAYPDLKVDDLARTIALGLVAANAGGRINAASEAE
jgi:phage gp29-like protein